MTAEARAPLAHRAADLAALAERTGGAITLRQVPFPAQVDLRIGAADAGRLAIPLPLEPNTVAEAGGREILWLGPDEWLVVAPPGSAGELVAELSGQLVETFASVVDVSANRAVLELGGRGARELLATGCPIDLHPRAWGPGRCTQTLFAGIPVLLHHRTDATRVLVRPSFAEHLVDLLLDAADTSWR